MHGAVALAAITANAHSGSDLKGIAPLNVLVKELVGMRISCGHPSPALEADVHAHAGMRLTGEFEIFCQL